MVQLTRKADDGKLIVNFETKYVIRTSIKNLHRTTDV